MIDMHNHVLYGVDDGAENLADSLAMIEKAVSLGFDTLALTPHYMTYRGYTAAPALCDRRMAEIETALLKDKVPVRLIAGNELLYDYDLVRVFGAGKFRTIGATDYYLIETTRQGGSALALQKTLCIGCIRWAKRRFWRIPSAMTLCRTIPMCFWILWRRAL